jgi:uncharacterized protein YndB with AHSA1/START domain
MQTGSDIRVTVVHRFNASAERVFDAWLSPELLGQWMFGAKFRDEEILRLAVDPRVGGSFSFLVRRQGEEIDHVGRYLEIDRPHRLVFTLGIGTGDSSRVIVDISPVGTGCELTLTHELHADWSDYAARARAGWTKMLAVLAAVLGEEGY